MPDTAHSRFDPLFVSGTLEVEDVQEWPNQRVIAAYSLGPNLSQCENESDEA